MIKKVITDPKNVRKFIVALVAALAIAGSEGLLPDSINSWVSVAIAFLSALGVYRVYNADPKMNSVSENI